MDTQAYISSGILELYVLGTLPVEELRDIEYKACQHVEIKSELEKIQQTFSEYLNVYSKAPPPFLKEKIFNKIEVVNYNDGVIKFRTKASSSSKMNWLAAASLALFIISSATSVYFAHQLNQSRQIIASLKINQQNTQTLLAGLQIKEEENERMLNVMAHPKSVKIVMNGTAKVPDAMAMVFWNAADKSVYLDIESLPSPPQDMEYQLWAIGDKGPVDEGVFEMKKGMIRMKDMPRATAFAVTLEPRGGSQSPNLDQMYVMGKVSI